MGFIGAETRLALLLSKMMKNEKEEGKSFGAKARCEGASSGLSLVVYAGPVTRHTRVRG